MHELQFNLPSNLIMLRFAALGQRFVSAFAGKHRYRIFHCRRQNLPVPEAHGHLNIKSVSVHRGNVERGFAVPDVEAFYWEMSAKGVLFSMPPKKQDFGGVLAQFVDSEGARCSVGAEAA